MSDDAERDDDPIGEALRDLSKTMSEAITAALSFERVQMMVKDFQALHKLVVRTAMGDPGLHPELDVVSNKIVECSEALVSMARVLDARLALLSEEQRNG